MEEDFYKGRLISLHGLEVIIPDEQEREKINRVIFDELIHGNIKPDSRLEFQGIIDRLALQGAQGIILGCTEIGLLVDQQAADLPMFDTAIIHAMAAVDLALT